MYPNRGFSINLLHDTIKSDCFNGYNHNLLDSESSFCVTDNINLIRKGLTMFRSTIIETYIDDKDIIDKAFLLSQTQKVFSSSLLKDYVIVSTPEYNKKSESESDKFYNSEQLLSILEYNFADCEEITLHEIQERMVNLLDDMIDALKKKG